MLFFTDRDEFPPFSFFLLTHPGEYMGMRGYKRTWGCGLRRANIKGVDWAMEQPHHCGDIDAVPVKWIVLKRSTKSDPVFLGY